MTSTETAEAGQFFTAMYDQIESTPLPAGRRLGWGVRCPGALTGRWPALPGPRASLVGLGVGLGGIASALIVVFNVGGSAQPAFAATLNPQAQTVTITLEQTQAIGPLNARLAALGTQIRVVPAVAGCTAPVQAVDQGQSTPGPVHTLEAAPIAGSAQVPAQVVTMILGTNIPVGDTEVVAETRTGLDVVDALVVGSAPACVGIAPGYPSAG